ncbi:hypothetical protein GDO81_030072 [Engystomops pustulosus]|uniref:Uncharacterized protein n=1 Tax=Engystomops pustulosus TaxID=76066 RepID=A0AAV6ZAZ2_ENGPU|nr:hypothetical protein GDO81_030072 [Engystomops pustulosus]
MFPHGEAGSLLQWEACVQVVFPSSLTAVGVTRITVYGPSNLGSRQFFRICFFTYTLSPGWKSWTVSPVDSGIEAETAECVLDSSLDRRTTNLTTLSIPSANCCSLTSDNLGGDPNRIS